MSSNSPADVPPPPPQPSTRPRKKRKVVEPRFVDIASLPDIDEIDLDSIKNFDKDQLRTYLKFYDITPGETKPDMKKQLRALIGAIRAGQVPKRSTTNPGATTIVSTPITKAISRVSVNTPIPTPLLTPYSSVIPTPQGAPVPTETQGPTREPDLFSMLMGIRPDGGGASSSSAHASIGTAAHNNVAIGAAGSSAAAPIPGPDDDDMKCLGCGKRANKDCKFRRCKNCCNAAMLRCTVHARFIPGLTSKHLLEEVPPGGLPVPPMPNAPAQQTQQAVEMVSYADAAREREREALLNVPPVPMVSFVGYEDMREEEQPDYSASVSVKRAKKRMKLNSSCVDEIFSEQSLPALLKSLEASLGTITPTSTGQLHGLANQLEADVDKWRSIFEMNVAGVQSRFSQYWELVHQSGAVQDGESWQDFKRKVETTMQCRIRESEPQALSVEQVSRQAGGAARHTLTRTSRPPQPFRRGCLKKL